MPTEKQINDFADTIAKSLVAKGMLIEAGASIYIANIVPADASEVQKQETRSAFFAGAQHVFHTIMRIMDEDREPTPADLQAVTNIDSELTKFAKELQLRMRTPQGSG